MFRVFAVLPAAGSGERLGKYPAKQYQKIEGRHLISYALSSFERLNWIEKIIVVVAVDEFDTMRDILKGNEHGDKVVLVPGEDTRHGSIYNGIKYMTSGHVEAPPDVVIVHDAVRPFVTEVDLNNITVEAFKHGAAGYIRPLVSTVVSKDKEGFLDDVFDRRLCFASETPQAFRYEVIREAYDSCSPQDIRFGTECLLLAKKHVLGCRVKLLDGEEHLWKVTYSKDLHAAVGVIKEGASRMVFIGDDQNPWRNLLHAVTKSKDSCVCSTVDSIPLPTIQNIILCYDSFNADWISKACKRCLEYFKEHCIVNRVVFVVSIVSNPEVIHKEMRILVKTLSAQMSEQKTVVYGICADKDTKCNTIGNMISSVVHNRNADLSGQLFTL